MDIQKLLDNLTEEVSCSVCGDIYKEPKQLPCLHSFCLVCLNDLARKRAVNGNIQCPLCQRQVAVPESGTFESLPSSFYINSLLDVLAIKQCSTSRGTCENCAKKSEDSSYCFHCSLFWCGECLNGHNILRANKEHRVVALTDFQAKDFEDVFKRPAICRKKHHHEVLKYYCKGCNVAACQACLNLEHSGHEIEHLEDVSEDEKAKTVARVKKAKNKIKQCAEQIESNERESLDIQQRAETDKQEVNNFSDKIVRIIQERQRELIAEIDKTKKSSQDELKIYNEQLQVQSNQILSAVDQAENLVLRGASAEIVTSSKQVEEQLQQVVTEEPEVKPTGNRKLVFAENSCLVSSLTTDGIGRLTHKGAGEEILQLRKQEIIEQVKQIATKQPERHPQENYKQIFVEHLFAVLVAVLAVAIAMFVYPGNGCLGNQSTAEGEGLSKVVTGLEAQFVVTTRNSKGDVCYSSVDRVAVEIKRRGDEDAVENVQVQNNKDGTYRVSYFAANPGDHDVRVTVNREDVRGSPFPPIQVKPRDFKRVVSFGRKGIKPGEFNSPWGVAVNEHGEIAVSDYNNHRVQVFSSEGKFLLSFGEEGSGQGQFVGPRGVTYDRDGNLLVADKGNNRIQKFTRTGQFMRNFGTMGEFYGKLSRPHGISSCPNGNIIVADYGNKRVVVFSPEGRALLTLKDDELGPVHCIYHDNFFIVSYGDGNCIKVYGEHGGFLHEFGREDTENGKFNVLMGIAIDKLGRLVVCDSDNNRIQLFKLDGTFCCKFDAQDIGPSNLNQPIAVAVLQDGKFAVTDWNGHRVQIIQ